MKSVIIKGDRVTIRTIEESDIKTLWNLIFKKKIQNGKMGRTVFSVFDARILSL